VVKSCEKSIIHETHRQLIDYRPIGRRKAGGPLKMLLDGHNR